MSRYVTLVQKQDMGTLYAMKSLRKVEVWRCNRTAHVKAERDTLSEADNEWFVKLHFSFQVQPGYISSFSSILLYKGFGCSQLIS